MEDPPRIGIAGSGFIGTRLFRFLSTQRDLAVSRMLTRSAPGSRPELPAVERVTNSIAELIDTSDLIVECTGDPVRAADIVDAALAARLPVVTMDSEFHVTVGSHFVGRGMLTEAEGDQPGSLAALREDALQMGFRPVAYANIKGFLNLNPTPEEMADWADRQGISLEQVTSFTDGTKIQIEQALVANAFGATIAHEGLLQLVSEDLDAAARALGAAALPLGKPISDFVICRDAPPGVFLVAERDQAEALNYLKLGPGPFYTLLRPFHLCHLEVAKTVRRVLGGGAVLLDNSRHPHISVAAVAKRDMAPGYRIRKGIGGFDVRGWAIRLPDHPHHVPIGLIVDATIARPVERGQMLELDDVELPESLALRAWLGIRGGMVQRNAVTHAA